MNRDYDLIVIGGGPAGMAAALEAKRNYVKKILIIERDQELGGILNQCIHNGFGIHHFKEELTGPEYSTRFIDEIKQTDIEILLDTMVLHIDEKKEVHAINSKEGYMKIPSKAIVLSMGCRERTRGAILIHGSRPSGVYTAGTAQRLINMNGYMPGKRVVILGSGDIGLIMARRMTLEGAKVEAVLEIMSHTNGLTRNVVQCLEDYDIPLHLSHTITQIHGRERVTGVTISKVDDHLKPLSGTERDIECDTILLSVGLIPENEVSKSVQVALDSRTSGPIVGELRQTNVDGIFACGNVLQVHDLVDFVSEEGVLAGFGAAQYIHRNFKKEITHTAQAGGGIGYIVPQKINIHNIDKELILFMRVKEIFHNHIIKAYCGGELMAQKKEHRFLPAEMVSLKIDKEKLQENENVKEILVQIESVK